MRNVMLVMVLAMFSGGCVTKRFIEAKPMKRIDPLKPINGFDRVRNNRAAMFDYYCPVSDMDDKHRKLYQDSKSGF